MTAALLVIAAFAAGYLAGRTRPWRSLWWRIKDWAAANEPRRLPWYRRYASDAVGVALIAYALVRHPRRTVYRIRHRNDPPRRAPMPKLNPEWGGDQ